LGRKGTIKVKKNAVCDEKKKRGGVASLHQGKKKKRKKTWGDTKDPKSELSKTTGTRTGNAPTPQVTDFVGKKRSQGKLRKKKVLCGGFLRKKIKKDSSRGGNSEVLGGKKKTRWETKNRKKREGALETDVGSKMGARGFKKRMYHGKPVKKNQIHTRDVPGKKKGGCISLKKKEGAKNKEGVKTTLGWGKKSRHKKKGQ